MLWLFKTNLLVYRKMSEYTTVEVNQQPIELCKLLKIANMVGGGGEAKIVISEGYVLLNGEVEFQKRKKIVANDIIEFNGEVIQVVYTPPTENDFTLAENSSTKAVKKPIKKATKSKAKNSPPNTPKNKNKTRIEEQIETISKAPKRRPISF